MEEVITLPLWKYKELEKDALNWRTAQYEGDTEKLAKSIEEKVRTIVGVEYASAKERLRNSLLNLQREFYNASWFGYISTNYTTKAIKKLLLEGL
jgi:hypothetical protein